MRLKKHLKIFLATLVLTFVLVNFTASLTQNLIINMVPDLKNKYAEQIDNNGIPTVDYGTVNGVYWGPQRNAVNISQTALKYWENYQRGDISSRGFFLNCANWLVANATDRRADSNDAHANYAILYYNFSWPPAYNITAPWRSGMAQGQALQVMIFAHQLTSDQKYLDTAKKLLNSFYVEVKDGGVTEKDSDGWWYEEFAKEDAKKSKVLNGMIFAILGVHDYYIYTQDEDAKYIFDQGVNAVKNNLALYDNHGSTYYDVLKTPAGEDYHQIHIDLLGQLYDITGEEVFKQYHDRWQKHADLPFVIKFVKAPTKMGWVVLFTNFLLIFLILELIFIFSGRLSEYCRKHWEKS